MIQTAPFGVSTMAGLSKRETGTVDSCYPLEGGGSDIKWRFQRSRESISTLTKCVIMSLGGGLWTGEPGTERGLTFLCGRR